MQGVGMETIFLRHHGTNRFFHVIQKCDMWKKKSSYEKMQGVGMETIFLRHHGTNRYFHVWLRFN